MTAINVNLRHTDAMSNSRLLNIDARPSDSPLVETIWRSHSSQAGPFLSIASSHWEMIVSQHEGRIYVSVRGPETQPTVAYCPPDGEWLGIQFKHGVFMPHLPVIDLVDGDVELPQASSRSFWLHGSTWELPTFDTVDTFVARLVKEELLVRDPVVESALQAHAIDLSPRSVQRRFLRATGLTHGAVSQIQRAHFAVALLRQGVSILDTVEQAGYADQPHLTRSLKRLIGQTPAQLVSGSHAMQLSFSSVIALAE
jgi:AraC-like DNA-binding protein